MSAMTLTSAFVYFAIMPRSTLFPTPDPAIMAALCPFANVIRQLIERIPTSRGDLILDR